MHSIKKRVKLILSVIIVFLICFVTAFILKERNSVYKYNVRKSYEYDFSRTNASIINLDLKGGEVNIPELNDKWDTAFLEVNINTTFFGYIFQPKIVLNNGKITLLQYFEYGAKGIRYINVSQLISKDNPQIRLRGKNVSLNDQSVKLILFKNAKPNKPRILVVSPHPDDAEIAAYGLYSSNKDSYIVTITAGDAGGKKYDEIYQDNIKHYLKKGEVRVWNSITVPLLGGIIPEHALNLGYFDTTLNKMYLDKSAVIKSKYTHISDINFYKKRNVSKLITGLRGESTWNSLVKDIQYLLNKIKPNIIVAPYPAIDSHPDHKFSTIALFEAIKKIKLEEGYLYLYTNHHVLSEFYPYGEMGSLVSLPPNFGKPLYFRSIYSHFLPVDRQKDKIFALEAMNDLRLDTEWRTAYGIIKKAIKITISHILGLDASYYRRAVRNNELFFVVNIRDIYNNEVYEKLKGKI